jgi:phage FluMu protein Com
MLQIMKVWVKCPTCKLVQELAQDVRCKSCRDDLSPWEYFHVEEPKK